MPPTLLSARPRTPAHSLATTFIRGSIFLLGGLASSIALCWLTAALVDTWPGSAYTAWVCRGVPPASRDQSPVHELNIIESRRALATAWETSYSTHEPYKVDRSTPPLIIPLWADPILRPWSRTHDGVEQLDNPDWPRDVGFPKIPYAVTAIELRAFGWPMHALFYTFRYTGTRQNPLSGWRSDGAWQIPGTTAPDRRASPGPITLPCRVRATGLIVDTVVFAAFWWIIATLAMLTFRSAQARRRTRRNHCPHCNYDLRATPREAPCPECGRHR